MSRCVLFWSSLLLFGLHQLLQKGLNVNITFLDGYLDPFLAMPIILGLFDWERQWRYGAEPLRTWEVIVVTIGFSLLFEWGFPTWDDRFTADRWDVAAYGLGSTVYRITPFSRSPNPP